jgi:hypothetical protein
VEIPRSALTYKNPEDPEWWTDDYVGPCAAGFIGTLKARIGSGSGATTLSVPAAVDSAFIRAGGWRDERSNLLGSLMRADTALQRKYWNMEVLPKDLPDSFFTHGRKPTRAQSLAYARDNVLNRCERYHATDSVYVSYNRSPCGGDNPPCGYSVPLCGADSLKAARAQDYEWMLGPDRLHVLVDTTALVGPNMTVSAAIEISCPTR